MAIWVKQAAALPGWVPGRPAGPVRMPGKAKPTAKGTSGASKPRKTATKSNSPPKAGATGKHASRLIDRRIRDLGGRTKPSWYAVTDEDRIISPALQREIAARIGARVLSLRAGHLPFLSKPKETAEVILAAVDFVRGK